MKPLSSCPICGSQDCSSAYEGRTYRNPEDQAQWAVHGCRACGHGFMNPQPSWDELQPYYSASYDPYEAEHGVADYEAELSQARKTGRLRHIEIEPGMRLLDVGCGGGVFLRLARDLGAEIQGVEPSPHGAATSRKNGVPVFNGTLDQFIAAHPAARFDVITANHVIEHHPDPVAVLQQMKSLLAENGKIWFAVPNADCQSARRLTWHWHSTDLPYHIMQFTPLSLRMAAERAGLDVERLRTDSMPAAVHQSMLAELRHRWKVPIRLSQRLPLMGLAASRARRMDKAGAGEALIAELRAPA